MYTSSLDVLAVQQLARVWISSTRRLAAQASANSWKHKSTQWNFICPIKAAASAASLTTKLDSPDHVRLICCRASSQLISTMLEVCCQLLPTMLTRSSCFNYESLLNMQFESSCWAWVVRKGLEWSRVHSLASEKPCRPLQSQPSWFPSLVFHSHNFDIVKYRSWLKMTFPGLSSRANHLTTLDVMISPSTPGQTIAFA